MQDCMQKHYQRNQRGIMKNFACLETAGEHDKDTYALVGFFSTPGFNEGLLS